MYRQNATLRFMYLCLMKLKHWYSILPTENALLTKLNDTKRAVLLKRFTKGLYGVYQQNKQVVISDLRMGERATMCFRLWLLNKKISS